MFIPRRVYVALWVDAFKTSVSLLAVIQSPINNLLRRLNSAGTHRHSLGRVQCYSFYYALKSLIVFTMRIISCIEYVTSNV